MPDAEKIIADTLEAAGVERGYVGAGPFRAHVAKHVAAALREAGMLTETEWEYVGETDTLRRFTDDAATVRQWRERGVYNIRRRSKQVPAGPWDPVEGDPR